jgi:hypothetical protein
MLNMTLKAFAAAGSDDSVPQHANDTRASLTTRTPPAGTTPGVKV